MVTLRLPKPRLCRGKGLHPRAMGGCTRQGKATSGPDEDELPLIIVDDFLLVPDHPSPHPQPRLPSFVWRISSRALAQFAYLGVEPKTEGTPVGRPIG